MKRVFSFFLSMVLWTACVNLSDIEDLQSQIDALKSNQIASIEKQVSNIQASITSLQATDTQLSTLLSTLSEDPSGTRAEIEFLDKTLNDRIDALKKYTDTELKNAKDWVSATFATLDQYQTLLSDLAGIKQSIKDIDNEIVESIEVSETSMKGWVNEQLSGYYTIAQMDVKLKSLEETDASIHSSITKLESELSTAKAELVEAYTKAISDAITKHGGEITSKIASDIKNATDKLQMQIDALDDRVSALEGMAQSITIVPECSDGSIWLSSEGILSFNSIIQPSSAVRGLAKDNFKILVTSTVTKANPIRVVEPSSVAIDETTGVVEVIADMSTFLPFDDGMSLAVALNVKAGIMDFASSFVPVTPEAPFFKISSIGSTVIAIRKTGTPYEISLEYRIGYGDWKPYIVGEGISLMDGEFVQFKNMSQSHFSKGKNDTSHYTYSYDDFYCIDVEGPGKITASGNILSLLDSAMRDVALRPGEFGGLFRNCNALVDASQLVLPAMTLADDCYSDMFFGCSSLTSAPALPATALAVNCYYRMFYGCSSLILAPKLPATILADYCYYSMFCGCESLISAPELPAKTLADYCYYQMFSLCTNLTSVPELPATSLAKYCYYDMFGFTSLISAPKLPAETLADYCYSGMFLGCASMTTAPELPATILKTGCYSAMFSGCASLTTAPVLPATIIPYGCYSGMFRNCKSLTSAPELPATVLAYSCYDSMFDNCTSLISAPNLPATTLSNNCYEFMFRNCTSLVTAPELPATNLAEHCYTYMFEGCTSLTSAPKLPATTLETVCYKRMFYGCTSLTSAPELPATTLAFGCYSQMFNGCTSLTSAPELPAMELESGCYFGMFEGCTGLTSAPVLPATTLTTNCYSNIFHGCSNLKYVKALFTSFPSGSINDWLMNVYSTGTFVKSADAIWDNSDVIPSGWTVLTE